MKVYIVKSHNGIHGVFTNEATAKQCEESANFCLGCGGSYEDAHIEVYEVDESEPDEED
jgi:hypothetical protein